MRSLVRFKCVLKSWKTLIYDPYFKKKHLNHAKNDLNSQKLLVSQRSIDKHEMYTLCCSLSSVQLVEDVQKHDCHLNCKPWGCSLRCCYDGLFLLSVFDGPDEHLLLWNPSTRESTVLPHHKVSYRGCTYGFGYDATSDDYKILKIDGNLPYCYTVPYEIFKRKSGSWRNIGNHPTGTLIVPSIREPLMDSLAFLHGAFHWLGCSEYIDMSERMCCVSNSWFKQLGRNAKNLGLNCLQCEILLFIPSNRNIGLGMVKCYCAADIVGVIVEYLGHPQDNLDYGLKVLVIPIPPRKDRKLDLS
ncbi:hypothetical protein RND71_014858 [Anisodus tanguticus]|uniref:F-box associated beta-propeller type 1 domain-containing protein n=1 Tax=Anisodus tanguticus TaxID=243964 RepID=A0AAE1SCN5_9SOLA|nr:hypothetical protein RND71_014858 [Anisodus tanguticus]